MRYTIFFFICFTCIHLSAQQTEEEILYTRAGFKGGVNYSNINGDFEDTSGRLRIHLGAVVEFPVTNRFFIQPEILYSAQGYKIDIDGEEQEISLNYLALPIVAKFFITPTLALASGPRFATISTVNNDDVEDDDPFFDSFESFDFGWVFGLEYKFESGLFLQSRYVLGISNINDTSINNVSNQNRLIQFSIGYLFKTKNNRRAIFDDE